MNNDASRSFGDGSAQYTRYRPTYPAAVFEFLQQNLHGERRCAVDLGAGSGQATAALASLFDHVTAIEPDHRLAAQAPDLQNIRMLTERAEDAKLPSRSVDAVISATAFHWMDQQAICNNVSSWLDKGGVFFPFSFDVFEPLGAAGDFFAEEFEKWRPFRDKRLTEAFDYHGALEKSGCFLSVTSFAHATRMEFTPEDAAGLICSASYASAYSRDHMGTARYFDIVREAFAKTGDKVTIDFPITGALGRVR